MARGVKGSGKTAEKPAKTETKSTNSVNSAAWYSKIIAGLLAKAEAAGHKREAVLAGVKAAAAK